VEARFGSFVLGFLEGLGSIAVTSLGLAALASAFSVPHPSASLFESVAQIGAALFVAFAVTLTAVRRGKSGRAEHLDWLGFGCGIGFAGLIGIGLSVALQAFREADHTGWIDLAGLAWALVALGMLGFVISVSPLMIFRSRESHGE
jgi:hypothetical protein